MKWTLLCRLSNERESSSNLFGLVLRLWLILDQKIRLKKKGQVKYGL